MAHRIIIFGLLFAPIAAGQEKPPEHPKLAEFTKRYAVPHDRAVLVAGKSLRIAPVPLLWGKDKFPDEFGLRELDAQDEAGENTNYSPKDLRTLTPYETLAMAAVDELAKQPASADNPPMRARWKAGDAVLADVLAFHEKHRKGKSWEKVRTDLEEKLLTVRIDLGKETAAAKDWPALRELVLANAERYRPKPPVVLRFTVLRLKEAEERGKSNTPDDLEAAWRIVREFEENHPNSAGDPAKPARTAIQAKIKDLIQNALHTAAEKPAEARAVLRVAEQVDPGQVGVQELRQRLKTAAGTIVVAARRMPEFLSPANARYDSERQVVELLFEGLLEAVPDETLGVDYRPLLVAGKPFVRPGIRELSIVKNAEWGGKEPMPFTEADVRATLKLTDSSDWGEAGGTTLQLALKRSHPDPRAALTFKVLPATWLLNRKLSAEHESFARQPFGTGPFQLPSDYKPNAKELSLVANPGYAKRAPGMTLRGVTFTDIRNHPDPVSDLRGGHLHIVPEVPTSELAKYEAVANAVVVKAANNRRIHLLALNHRVETLQNVEIRRGLMAAVDREKILAEVFRAGVPAAHAPLAGPFPPESWAVPKGAPALFNGASATVKLQTAADKPLTLLLPDDDPLAKAACEKIAAQVTVAGLPMKTEAVPPRMFLQRVELEHRYDVAYLAFDYPDDWYPLALEDFLDGESAERGGRNVCGFMAPRTRSTVEDRRFAEMFPDLRRAKDFDGAIRPKAQAIHAKFAAVVPFVPLWQLDRHTAIAKSIALPFPAKLLDPGTLFTDVRHWSVR